MSQTILTREIVLRGPLEVWQAIALGSVLAAAALVLYLFERGHVHVAVKTVLALLRTAVFAALLILLLGPFVEEKLERTGENVKGHRVILLVDNSQSMKQADRRLLPADKARVAIAKGLVPLQTALDKAKLPDSTTKDPSRLELARAVLEHKELDLGQALAKVGPVRPFLFGASLHGPSASQEEVARHDPVKWLLKALNATEASTNLADAIHDILTKKEGGELPAAIVVLTDGLDNASKYRLAEVATQCGQAGVPLHIYGAGTPEGGSLQLREVASPDTLFYDDTAHIPVRWRAQGFKKGTVEISVTLGGVPIPLLVDGKEVLKKDAPLRLGEDLRDLVSFTPRKSPDQKERSEHQDLVVTLRLKDDKIQKPDSITRPVRLSDTKVRVLYIEGSPRFEYKYLQAALQRDRRVEVQFLLANADAKVLNSGPPFLPAFPTAKDKFFEAKYNLILFGDVPVGFLNKDQLEWIQEFVKNRGGLIFLAGKQHLPGGYDKTSPLFEVLPVEVKPGKLAFNPDERTQEYPPTLTSIGERADMLSLADTAQESRKTWESLPGFHWHYPLVKLRPGATALMVNPRAKMGDQPMPIVVQQFFGKGHVLFFGTDETWRWRFNVADKHYTRFWGQIIYQLGLPHLLGDNAQRTQLALERAEAILGQPGKVFARLLDKDFNPRKDDEIEAVLESEGKDKGQKIKLHRLADRDGEYWALLDHSQPGKFTVHLNNPEPASFSYRVLTPPRHELEEAGMAEAVLRQAARSSGGAFYREEDLFRLPESLTPRTTTYPWREEEVVVYDLFWWLFVAFLVLITAEWLVRKFSDLS